jgi:hypothetical protein
VPGDSLCPFNSCPLRHALKISVAVRRANKCDFAKRRGAHSFQNRRDRYSEGRDNDPDDGRSVFSWSVSSTKLDTPGACVSAV